MRPGELQLHDLGAREGLPLGRGAAAAALPAGAAHGGGERAAGGHQRATGAGAAAGDAGEAGERLNIGCTSDGVDISIYIRYMEEKTYMLYIYIYMICM